MNLLLCSFQRLNLRLLSDTTNQNRQPGQKEALQKGLKLLLQKYSTFLATVLQTNPLKKPAGKLAEPEFPPLRREKRH